LAPTSGVLTSTTFNKASTFDMPPKRTVAPGAALTLQEEELDQEIRNLEVIHQQVQRKKQKMAQLANLQKKIDEAAEEMCHLTQDDHDQRPQHREVRQESSFNEDEWYDDFYHGSFTFDDASPLVA
jgi:ABC-type Fe3+-citrate transport system substrate-binding protein